MNRHMKWGHLIALVAFALLAGTLAMAASPAGGSVAVVSMSGIYSKYEGTKIVQERMNNLRDQYNKIVENMDKGMGLSPTDFDEYMKLVGQGIAINQKKIEEFQAQALALADEYKALNAKKQDNKDLPAEDAARLEALTNDMKAVNEKMNERGEKMQQNFGNEMNFYYQVLDKLVTDGIAKVASDKKCTIVLSKDIQVSQTRTELLVLWGGNDITDDVVNYLQKNFDKAKKKFDEKH